VYWIGILILLLRILSLAFQPPLCGRLKKLIEVQTSAPIMRLIGPRQGFPGLHSLLNLPPSSIPICSGKDPPFSFPNVAGSDA
jgi:hypothetical protein